MIGTKNPVSSEEMTVLIDADSLLYFSSYGSEEDQVLSEVKLTEKVYDILNIIEQAYPISRYFIFVKGRGNFRYRIYPGYKAKRPKKHPIIDILAKHLVESMQAVEAHNAESDDYVFSYSQHPDLKGRTIICSIDKDLYQIPGIHYNYQKNKFLEINEDQANYNFALQMLMGDSSDGIPGLKGYGPVKAGKAIRVGMNKRQLMKAVFKEYQKVCKNPKEEMRLHYKLLKLHHVYLEKNI